MKCFRCKADLVKSSDPYDMLFWTVCTDETLANMIVDTLAPIVKIRANGTEYLVNMSDGLKAQVDAMVDHVNFMRTTGRQPHNPSYLISLCENIKRGIT